MTDKKPEPDWNMGWFLWPVGLYFRFKGWLIRKGIIRPPDGEK